ncbi:MAG: hypothetical protein ING19_00710 [Azospirillum sp.]|nr:hypothetical protein [Azospirillum sp.]
MRFKWTEENVKIATEMWMDGKTLSEIGRRLGVGKNAVVGKIHRLGLPLRPSPIRGRGEIRPQTPSSPPPSKIGLRMVPKRKREREPTIEKKARLATQFAGLEANPGNPCAYPLWSKKTMPGAKRFFCEKPSVGKTPYCAEHAALCYAPRQTRPATQDSHSNPRMQLTPFGIGRGGDD